MRIRLRSIFATSLILTMVLGVVLLYGGSAPEILDLGAVLFLLCTFGCVASYGTWFLAGKIAPHAAGKGAQFGSIPALMLMWLVGLGEFGVSGHHVAILYMILMLCTVVPFGLAVGAFVGLAIGYATSDDSA